MINKSIPHIALFVATLLFGANYYVSKLLLTSNLNPEQLLFIRTFGALVLFWIVEIVFPSQKIDRRTFWLLAPAALLGVALNQGLFFKGLEYTTAVNAAIIHVSNPIIVLILSILFLNYKLTGLKALGVVLGAIGASSLILKGAGIQFSSLNALGNLLVFANTAAYGAYLILLKPILKNFSALSIMKWVYLWGFIEIFPFTFGDVIDYKWANLGITEIWALGFLVVAVTFFAYLLTSFALQHISTTAVSYYIYLQPLVATIIATVVGNESLFWWQLIAASLIFLGASLVNWKNNTVIESIN